MGVFAGPDVSESGLVFALDVANQKCISPLGCTGFNNAPQLVKNLVSTSDTINSYNGVKLDNLSYYTVFAIDYPEGSYGGDAASRQGITPGYDVRSGAKTYDASRALHLWVWNNDTNSWIADNYFRGFRLSGHCYDNYSGAENGYNTELTYFAEDFNTIKNTFPNCTYIVMGSHRADRYNSTVRSILSDLGKPNGYIDSDYIPDPEWILVGKPGLGAGNAYGWAYENYSTNPTRVAHLNFGLPIYGTKDNYLGFDGTNDYITTANTTVSGNQTFSVWAMVTGGPNAPAGILTQHNYTSTANFGINHIGGNKLAPSIGYTNNTREYDNKPTTFTITNNVIFNAVLVYNSSENKIYWYINGQLDSSYTLSATPKSTNWPVCLGRWDAGYNNYYFNGRVYSGTIHNKALSAAEIQQNFNANRSRFGV